MKDIKSKNKSFFRRVFEAGVVLKGLNGILELLCGIFLLVITDADLNTDIAILTQGDLSRDPKDFIFRILSHFAHDVSSSAKLFAGIYLLSHGLLKIGMAIGLLKKKIWAYPASIIFLFLFVCYQSYRLALNFSLGLLLLTMLDSALILLIWREYQVARHNLNNDQKI